MLISSCRIGAGASLLFVSHERREEGVMAVDTDTQQWATREELRALEKQVSKLEGQFSESNKRLAT